MVKSKGKGRKPKESNSKSSTVPQGSAEKPEDSSVSGKAKHSAPECLSVHHEDGGGDKRRKRPKIDESRPSTSKGKFDESRPSTSKGKIDESRPSTSKGKFDESRPSTSKGFGGNKSDEINSEAVNSDTAGKSTSQTEVQEAEDAQGSSLRQTSADKMDAPCCSSWTTDVMPEEEEQCSAKMGGDAPTPKVIIVYGPLGSGKPVQIKNISRVYGYVPLTASEIIENVKLEEKHHYCELVRKLFRENKAIPGKILCELFMSAMEKSAHSKFLFDDFPQSDDELRDFITLLKPQIKLIKVLYFKCPIDICVRRKIGGHNPMTHREHIQSVNLYRKVSAYCFQVENLVPVFKAKGHIYDELNTVPEPEVVFSRIKALLEKCEDI